jgi:Protein of unknown function (DUF4238)
MATFFSIERFPRKPSFLLMPPNQPKSHHFIPRLHLAHFAGHQPPGQVWTYDKNSGASYSAIPEETGVQNHFYSYEREDGSFDTQLETGLSQLETCAAPIYERLVRGERAFFLCRCGSAIRFASGLKANAIQWAELEPVCS